MGANRESNTFSSFRLPVTAWIAAIIAVSPASLRGEEQVDLYSLVLIQADLQDANREMTIHDPNEDGELDAVEQKRLSWASDAKQYDLRRRRAANG